MSWFKVDDGFYDHPKVIGMDLAAIGLWTLAGAYCARHLTDGVISDRQVRAIGGTRRQAEKLVAAGLWSARRDADDASPSARRYVFNDWRDFQPLRDEVTTRRREDADRKREARAAKRDKQRKRENVQPDVQPESENPVRPESLRRPLYPTRPDPTRPDLSSTHVERGGLRSERASDPPTPRCPKHINDERPPACGACADARRAREAWDADEARSRSERQRFEREQQAADIRAEIDACELCDERGYVGGRVCDHDPEAAERNARGMAQVRAILGGGEIERAALTAARRDIAECVLRDPNGWIESAGGALAKCSHGRQIGGAE